MVSGVPSDPLGKARSQGWRQLCFEDPFLGRGNIVGNLAKRNEACIKVVDSILGARVTVTRLANASRVDQVSAARGGDELQAGFDSPYRTSSQVGIDHGAVSVPEKSHPYPRVSVSQVIEDQFGCFGCSKVSGSIPGQAVEKEDTWDRCRVDRQFAKALAGTVGKGVPGPPYGMGGSGVEAVGFCQVAGSLLMVAGNEDGIQVGKELKTRERLGTVPHSVTKVPDSADSLCFHVCHNGFQGRQVGMDIRKNCNSHRDFIA
jgi:hypothetical protein